MHDFKSKTVQYPFTYWHFKMESINQAIGIIRYNVYMTSIDLKVAFLIILVYPEQHKHA